MFKEFDIKIYLMEKRPIIIYGAGIFGECALRALQQYGIEPVCFCDKKKAGTVYLGFPVYDYKIIAQYEEPVVLLAAGKYFKDICQFLLERGITELYSIYRFVFQNPELSFNTLSLQRQDMEYYQSVYCSGMNYEKNTEGLYIYSLDWIITTRCSLRCMECSNLMQYYHKPENLPIEMLQEELSKVLDIVDGIWDIRVIGGEPFMHPKIGEIMEPFLDHPKIYKFSIYTNASILPRESTIKILKHPKVKCEITNYGELVKKYPGFIKLMQEEHIRHRITQANRWQALGGLWDRKSDEETLRKTFQNCYCNDLPTLLAGKIYRCPYSANGRMLEAIPFKEEDIVDLDSGSKDYLKYKLKYLLSEKNFDHACGYCNGRNFHQGGVKPAIQTKQPLEYKKYFE